MRGSSFSLYTEIETLAVAIDFKAAMPKWTNAANSPFCFDTHSRGIIIIVSRLLCYCLKLAETLGTKTIEKTNKSTDGGAFRHFTSSQRQQVK